ncbi:hypothetical protein K439DRAFT_1631506 [Ramaria rubella]|nr:hypothetical protein K439DRAFT_1631506 [Ramaria rubella]
MPSFTQLFTLAALVTVGLAASVSTVGAHCAGAQLVSGDVITVGGHDIIRTTHSCSGSVSARQATTPDTDLNVCGLSCTTSCNNVTGILPPIQDDCDTIANSIGIFADTGALPPTFNVAPDHVQTLSFGTCEMFLENFGSETLEACWSDMATNGNAAGSACFPPHQPFFPEGVCTSYDGTWAFGATHS